MASSSLPQETGAPQKEPAVPAPCWWTGAPGVSCKQKARNVDGKTVVTLEGLAQARRAGVGSWFCRRRSVPMRILLARHSHEVRGAAGQELLAYQGGRSPSTGREHVQVHWLREDRRGGDAGCGRERGEALPPLESTGAVGSRQSRYRGEDLVLGSKPFINDLRVPSMLHGAICFSEHPRGRVLRINTSKAVAYPGVVAVATAKDTPGQRYQGPKRADCPQLVDEGEETRCVADVLAAVAAETRNAARSRRFDRGRVRSSRACDRPLPGDVARRCPWFTPRSTKQSSWATCSRSPSSVVAMPTLPWPGRPMSSTRSSAPSGSPMAPWNRSRAWHSRKETAFTCSPRV